MAQNPSFPWVRSLSAAEQEDRNESPQRKRLRAVFAAFQDSGAGSGLALDILLHEFAEEALFVPGASSSAIALREPENHFVCRAVAGEPAPAIGTRIEAQDGLSAECVRTGSMQVCQDTETNTRVDGEICRVWGVRSLVIVPLFLQQTLVGILEVFAPVPEAFDRASIERLRNLGHHIVETVAYAERAVQAQPVLQERAPAPLPYEAETPRIETWTETPLPEPAPASPVQPEAATAKPESWQIERDASTAALTTAELTTALGTPATVALLQESPSQSVSTPVAPVRKRRNLGLALVALAAGVVAVVGLLQLPSESSKSGAGSLIAKQVLPAPDPSRATAASTSVTHTAPVPVLKLSPSSKPQTAPSGDKSAGEGSAHTGGLVVYEKGKVIYRALPGSGMMIGPMTSAAETEKLRDTLEAGAITGGKLIHQVDPVLPQGLAGLQLPQEVLLEGVVGQDGVVRDIRFLRGDARLTAAAIEAVRQWRYEPFRSNGERVDMLCTLLIRFQ